MTFKRSVAEDWFDSFELYLKEFFLFEKKENDYFYFKCHHKDINMFNQIIYLIYVECNFYSCGRFMGGFLPPPPPAALKPSDAGGLKVAHFFKKTAI